TDFFVLRNSSGDYENIDISVQTPNSWLKIIGLNSLNPNQADELPLRIELEASAEEWGRNYTEYIVVKLDEEEIRIKVELNTKTKGQQPTPFSKKKLIPIIIIPVFILIFSCFSINYLTKSCAKQNNKTVETEDSHVEVSVSSSNGITGEENTNKFNFDGKLAYFGENKNIFIIDPKNENNKISEINIDYIWDSSAKSANIAWSTNGDKIAFGCGMDLYVLDIYDLSINKIYTLRTPEIDDEDDTWNRGFIANVAWSTIEDEILFAVSSTGANEEVFSELILININNKDTKTILRDNRYRFFAIDWSPSGNKIVYSIAKGSRWDSNEDMNDYCKLGLIDVNNNYSTSIFSEFPGWTNDVNYYGRFITNTSWSPNEDIILFDVVTEFSNIQDDDNKICSINIEGNKLEEITNGNTPNWSIDGKYIIYGNNDGQIVLADKNNLKIHSTTKS
ncbi:MAG: hypothetical protein M1308_01720, partial [Actinobacteria bacterium]|nr:hypothetical protein [Actinomycetota bacterium]